MAITFAIADGEFVAVVDTVREFEEALEFTCPIIAPPELANAWGIREPHPDSAEWDHACQVKEDRWTTLEGGEQ